MVKSLLGRNPHMNHKLLARALIKSTLMTTARWDWRTCGEMMINTINLRSSTSNRSSTTTHTTSVKASLPQWTSSMTRNGEMKTKSTQTKEDRTSLKISSTRSRWSSKAANCIKSSLIRSRTKTRFMPIDIKVPLVYGTLSSIQWSILRMCCRSFCSSWLCTHRSITRSSCHILLLLCQSTSGWWASKIWH